MRTLSDFALNEDQKMIREAAEIFLAETSSSAAVRSAMEMAVGYDAQLWARIGSELGWCSTYIPEAYDGLGLSYVELTLLMEQMGRRLVCSPFLATVCLAANAILEIADEAARARYLPQIAAGTLTATLALSSSGIDWQPDSLESIVRREADGYVLTGLFRHVPDGSSADLLLVPAYIDNDSLVLLAVPASTPGISRVEHLTIDRTRRLTEVRFENVNLPADAILAQGKKVAEGFQRTVALAAIALAAEQLGGAQQCLDLTLAYAAERVQFGRVINTFQAVKHRCAEMMIKIEATRSAVFGAARVANASPSTSELALEAACVKAFASETFFFCARETIQLHGGVGFTWEYDPHLYFKRAQASSHWLGSIDTMRERAAAALLDHV